MIENVLNLDTLQIANPTLAPVAKVVTQPHNLPKEAEWINTIGKLPKTMEIILGFCGLLEKRGPDDNPTIIDWAVELGVQGDYKHDSTPWCGLGQGVGVKRAEYPLPPYFLAAKSWAGYGKPIARSKAKFGDILVFNRGDNPTQGHVARYCAENAKYFWIYGANQADSWSFEFIPKWRLYAVRRDPFKIGAPASVKKYTMDNNGVVKDTNEA